VKWGRGKGDKRRRKMGAPGSLLFPLPHFTCYAGYGVQYKAFWVKVGLK